MIPVIVMYNVGYKAKVYACKSMEQAQEVVERLYAFYLEQEDKVDWNETFISGDSNYAQVSYGIEMWTICLGDVIECPELN